jgi:hypothetical protein
MPTAADCGVRREEALLHAVTEIAGRDGYAELTVERLAMLLDGRGAIRSCKL